jgi:hypothetical protein
MVFDDFGLIDDVHRAVSENIKYGMLEVVAYLGNAPGHEFVVWELPAFSCNYLNVKFYTGFDENACPYQLKQAVLMKVADFYYVERQSYSPQGFKYNEAIERLLSKYKNVRF